MVVACWEAGFFGTQPFLCLGFTEEGAGCFFFSGIDLRGSSQPLLGNRLVGTASQINP